MQGVQRRPRSIVTTEKTEAPAPRPTVWQVARRPRWIGVLALALIVAAVFAILAQWQTARAIEQGQGDDRDTETPVALASVAEPQSPMLSVAGGRMVTVAGVLDPVSLIALPGRIHDGTEGWWVTGRIITDEGSLAVALGWAADEGLADAAIDRLTDEPYAGAWLGRYMPSEAPQIGEYQSGETMPMSVPAFINVWPGFEGDVYSGYLISEQPFAGLVDIEHARPETSVALNWLNVFYALEWVVFAIFAFYLWYRLVKDAWEREIEELDEREGIEPAL